NAAVKASVSASGTRVSRKASFTSEVPRMLGTLENWKATVLPQSRVWTPRSPATSPLQSTGCPESWLELGLPVSLTIWKIDSRRQLAPKATEIGPAQPWMRSPASDISAWCCVNVVRFCLGALDV